MKRRIAAVAASALTLSGCSLGQGLYNAPLPGGADVGAHPLHVTVDFRDALDLVPQSAVRVNDVAVGRVTSIDLAPNGRTAEVHLLVRSDVELPANATASVQQTSLLGEKYVALEQPLNAPPQGTLRDGAVIGVDRTTTGVEAEQVLGALSLLLNAGGVGQLHDITSELNKFAHGHEQSIRDFMDQLASVLRQLNAHRASITGALDALDTLSRTLAANNTKIARVLRGLAPGLGILAVERDQLVNALDALHRLSDVTVSTVDASRQDFVADLARLRPILGELADAGTALPQSLQALLTFPFTDAVLSGIKGDYLNTFATTALNTPGGRVVTVRQWPGSSGNSTENSDGGASGGATTDSDSPATVPPPPGLLPADTQVAPGLSTSIVVAPGSAAPRVVPNTVGAR